MRFAIAGAGAMGSRIGYYLAKNAGQDVTLVDSWPAHVDAINQNGLSIQTESGTTSHPMNAVLARDVEGVFDVVILLTKAMTAREMMQTLLDRKAIDDNTKVLCMMNGLGHTPMIADYVKQEHIYLAVTVWTAGLKGPGQVLLEGAGSIEFQRADGQSDAFGEELARILNEAGLHAKLSDDILTSIWNKAAVNCVFNTFCTVLDRNIMKLAEYSRYEEMIRPLVNEIVTVGNARGAHLDEEAILTRFRTLIKPENAGLHFPSMHQDMSNGRLTEVDYLTGAVARYGKELGIPTPYSEMITHLVHHKEEVKDRS